MTEVQPPTLHLGPRIGSSAVQTTILVAQAVLALPGGEESLFYFVLFPFSFFFSFSLSPVPNFILELNSVDVLVHPSIHRAAMDALGFHGIPHLATPPSHFSTIILPHFSLAMPYPAMQISGSSGNLQSRSLLTSFSQTPIALAYPIPTELQRSNQVISRSCEPENIAIEMLIAARWTICLPKRKEPCKMGSTISDKQGSTQLQRFVVPPTSYVGYL